MRQFFCLGGYMRKFSGFKSFLFLLFTKKNILFLVLTIVAAFTKVYELNFILGIAYAFSGLFLLIILRLYNIKLAVLSSLAVQLIALLVLDYPNLGFLSVLEIVFIGILASRKPKVSMVLWDIIYWILIGLPISALVYYSVFNGGNGSVFYIQVSKDITNGVLNCVIADVLLTYVPFDRWMGIKNKEDESIYFHKFIFHTTTIIIIVTFILSFIINSIDTYETMKKNTEYLADNYASGIQQEIKQWEIGEQRQLMVLGRLQLEKLNRIINRVASDGTLEVTITDAQNRILATNNKSFEYRQRYDWKTEENIENISEKVYQSIPSNDFQRFKLDNWASGSYIYINEITSPNLNIIIKYPINQFQKEILSNFLEQIQLFLYLVLFSFMFTILTNRFLVKTLKHLSMVTTGLPLKIGSDEKIEWPNSKVSEIKLLVNNFKHMSDNLKSMFKESRDLNETLAMQAEKLRKSEEELHKLAYYDSLTGLHNRLAFKVYLEDALNIAKDNGTIIAVMFIDLNQFKQINDTMGHSAGDELLKIVAERLAKLKDDNTAIFRLGGDEFVVVRSAENEEEVRITGEYISKIFSKPIGMQDVILHVTGSIGISMFPRDGQALDTLVKHADMAMYSSKEKGRGNVEFYHEGINKDFEEYMLLDSGIREALENNQFELHYQPKINAETGQISSMEALIRWRHPKLGYISPAKFIPVAEKSGVIFQIDEWVVNEACRQNKSWQDSGLPRIPVSVNVSAKHFYEGHIINIIKNALDKSKLEEQYLRLEITEGVLIKNTKYAIEIIRKLRSFGVSVSIDDFGMGYSALSQLLRLTINELKLDREFIREIGSDSKKASMVKLIVDFAHNINLNVVAEGIETEEELNYLKEIKCDELQGFYFSKPLSKEDFKNLLQQTSESMRFK